MMFNARLPEFFGASMIGQFETDRRFVLLELTGSDFDVEIVPFV